MLLLELGWMFIKKNHYHQITSYVFLPNTLLLPHLGYVTAENYSIFYTQMLENLDACVNGKPTRIIE